MDVIKSVEAVPMEGLPQKMQPRTAPVEPVQREQIEVNRNTLQRAVDSVNTSLASYQRHLSVRSHEGTGRLIVRVYDSETQEMIREIPPENVLNAHAHILELAGLFVDARR